MRTGRQLSTPSIGVVYIFLDLLGPGGPDHESRKDLGVQRRGSLAQTIAGLAPPLQRPLTLVQAHEDPIYAQLSAACKTERGLLPCRRFFVVQLCSFGSLRLLKHRFNERERAPELRRISHAEQVSQL